MAVIRDYLITQFSIYGISLMSKQFDDMVRGYERNLIRSMSSTKMKMLEPVKEKYELERKNIKNTYDRSISAHKGHITRLNNIAKSRPLTTVEEDKLKIQTQKFNDLKKLREREMANLKANYAREKAQTEEHLKALFEKKMNFARKLARVGLTIALTATGIFFAIARSFYNVMENIEQAIKLSLDFGKSVRETFGVARAFNILGLNASMLSSAVDHLSKALVANKNAGAYMMAWMGMSPYELFNLPPEAAIERILKGLERIPDISKRNYIASQLLGDSWKDLIYAREVGAFDLADTAGRNYTEGYLKKVLEANKAWAEMKLKVQDLGISISITLMPVIEKLSELFKYFADNQTQFWLAMTSISAIAIALGIMTGMPLLTTGGIAVGAISLAGLFGSFGLNNEISNEILSETRRQTTLMDMTYRSINSLRMDLNAYLATTSRQTSNLYQVAIYRALLTNTGGF